MTEPDQVPEGRKPPARSAIRRLAQDPASRRRFIAVGGGTSLAASSLRVAVAVAAPRRR